MNYKFIICNWKMNCDQEYFNQINSILSNYTIKKEYKLIICPPLTLLNQENIINFEIGAQNCASEEFGSYTGEVSARMISQSNARYVIIGHSERRKYFNEKPELILKKMDQVMDNNLTPIVCVKRFYEDKEYIKNLIFNFISNVKTKNLLIAYEPEESIGSGIPDNLYSIQENIESIKDIYRNHNLNDKNIFVIYGGSVDKNNIKEIISISDGVLIGKASINLEQFIQIIKII
ncbi:MAG: triosephosphate isomerase [Saprospiraceae bacterium]|nr:triosephosphate isomerase [Saprospiraceae bacterium]